MDFGQGYSLKIMSLVIHRHWQSDTRIGLDEEVEITVSWVVFGFIDSHLNGQRIMIIEDEFWAL
jgi:hypothetical protein